MRKGVVRFVNHAINDHAGCSWVTHYTPPGQLSRTQFVDTSDSDWYVVMTTIRMYSYTNSNRKKFVGLGKKITKRKLDFPYNEKFDIKKIRHMDIFKPSIQEEDYEFN